MLELLLVVGGDCSAGAELGVGEGTGAEGNDVQVVEVHLVVFGGHLPVEPCHYHPVQFL